MSRAGHRRNAKAVVFSVIGFFVVAAATQLASTMPGANAQTDARPTREIVLYEPPLVTEVIDTFRPPSRIGGAGNRGLEYGNADNQVVAAAAPGWVTFAGPVAGRKVITIEHADGVRTTYTGLLEMWVDDGQTVSAGAAIARASQGFHFGARIRNHYLDPQILFDASSGPRRVRLVPDPN